MSDRKPPWAKPALQRFLNPSKNPLSYFQIVAKSNDIARLPLIKPNYLINNPDAIHHVLLSNNENYTKAGTGYERIEQAVGLGLLTASGEEWERRHAIYQPLFRYKHIKNYFDIILKYAEQLVLEWQHLGRGTFNISEEMLSSVMKISSEILLGVDISSHSLEQVRMIRVVNAYYVRSSMLFSWLPTLANIKFQIAKKMVDKFLRSLKDQDRSTAEPLLGNLLAKDDNGNLLLPEDEMLGEIKNFFIAGHETTGNVLAWNLYNLAKNPYVLNRLRDEITQVLGTDSPTVDNIEELPYLTLVINETLRLYPPIWIITRRALAKDKVNNFTIPRDAIVNVCPYLIQRHPRYWNQPDIFYPERFLPEAGSRPKCAYIPFGFGPRVCIGRQMATLILKVLTAIIIQKFTIGLPKKDYHAEPLPLITLKAKKDIMLNISRRD